MRQNFSANKHEPKLNLVNRKVLPLFFNTFLYVKKCPFFIPDLGNFWSKYYSVKTVIFI